jgi:hypothetical protein
MIDWNSLLQAIVSSGIVAGFVTGVVLFVFQKYTEKRLEHIFNRRLKEYESKLEEATALRIGIGTDRIEEYKRLSALINTVRKHVVTLLEKPNLTTKDISELMSEARALEKMIYDLSITLQFDRIYERVHSYKVKLVSLIKNFENEKILRDKGQTERANGVKEIINQAVVETQSECEALVKLLVTLIQPRNDS